MMFKNTTKNFFVMVSADDCARPILGYSEEGAFDVNNIAPGLGDMMENYQEAVSYGQETKAKATAESQLNGKLWKNQVS